jgi:AcrR family transcriptional regulator
MNIVPEIGLRERKRLHTRQLIQLAAQQLFEERGFDAVSVAEIARSADFSEMTVFNHFPTKEDLVFSGMGSFEDRLLEAIRQRPEGEPAIAALRRAVLGGTEHQLATPEAAAAIGRAARLISSSRALQNREREVVARHADALAHLLAEEAGRPEHALEAAAVANALMGVHVALLAHVRTQVLAGVTGDALAAGVRTQARRAFARLEAGLADYGARKPKARRRVAAIRDLPQVTTKPIEVSQEGKS